MSPNIKNAEGIVIGRMVTADKKLGVVRILKTVGELGSEYIFSQVLNHMGVKEGTKVDVTKITDKKGRLFMEVKVK